MVALGTGVGGWTGMLGGDRSDVRPWGPHGAAGDGAAGVPMSPATWWPVSPWPSGAQVHDDGG